LCFCIILAPVYELFLLAPLSSFLLCYVNDMLCCFNFCFCLRFSVIYFFLYDSATTEIYTLSLHDALPIY